MSERKKSARRKIVDAALPIAEAPNRVGAMEYIEGRLLGNDREAHSQLLGTWRKSFLDWLRLGEFTVAKMLFMYAKLCERLRNGFIPFIVVTA